MANHDQYCDFLNSIVFLVCLYFLVPSLFFLFLEAASHSVAQAGPGAHSYPPASASQELGSQVCATTPSLFFFLFYKIVFLSSFDFFYK